MCKCMTTAAVAAVVLVCASGAQAEVVIDTVSVGSPANPADTRYATPGYGGVYYVYNIGKYEVTTGQYTEFLNAVADDDTYGLYNTRMSELGWAGCNIQRSGSPGNYSYSVPGDWADRPVNWVSWGDAVRFSNWLYNDQPTGPQGLATTEDGSYFLDGATSEEDLMAVTREPDATWVIPTEDEWYKPAYHKNDGVTGNYWDYPMGGNAVPNNGNPGGDTGNSANILDGGPAIGPPYHRTEVGYFGLSDSPYGTFDQGGNVWEWNETLFGSGRGLRGGSMSNNYPPLHADYGESPINPTAEYQDVGFRLAYVPEPTMITLLALGSLGIVRRRKQ